MRTNNKHEKKKLVLCIVLLLIIGLGIGYAILTEQLKLNGSVNYGSMAWDVGFTTAVDGGGTISSSPTVSNDKKSVTVTCNVGTSTASETCIAKATIKNNSTFAVELESKPTITYDNAYINSVEAIWTDSSKNVLAADYIGVGETKEVQITITTKALTNDMLPESTLSIPITIIMNWIQTENKSLKVLSVGNSFSQDSLEYVYQIAEDLGYKEIKLGNLYIGSGSLSTHLLNAKNDSANYVYFTNTSGTWEREDEFKISTAVQSEEWDYITFQQASGSSGLADTYNDLNDLIEIIKPLSPNSNLAWHMTWAYQSDSTHSDFANYNNNQMTMYNAIVSAVQNKIATNENIDIIIPVGTAIQNARTSDLGDTLTRDGYHLTYTEGRYIAGVSFIHALTGKSVNDLTYKPTGVSDEVRLLAIESANSAYENPYSVTQSQYTSSDSEEEEEDTGGEAVDEYADYDLVELTLYKNAYYNSSSSTASSQPPAMETTAYNARYYWATQVFTQETLPVGSIILIESGWQYRADGWNFDSDNNYIVNDSSTRPTNTTTLKFVVDEAWWEPFKYRGFNIATYPSVEIHEYTEDQINAAFKIYVPKTN